MPIPLIAMAAGAAVKAYGQHQADKGAADKLAAGLRQQAADRSKAMGVVGNQLQYATNATPEARTGQALDDYMGALRGGAAGSDASYTPVAGANSRYAQAVAAAKGTAGDLAARRAQFMSVLRGMQRERGDINQHFLDAGTAVSGIGQDTNDDMRAAGLAVQKAAQVNPAYGIAGNLISNAGSAFEPAALKPSAPAATGYNSSTFGNDVWGNAANPWAPISPYIDPRSPGA
jgi:hypothetical protein